MSEELQGSPVSEEQKTEGPVPSTPAPEAPKADVSDGEQNKIMAIVGYIVPFLFFVPMLAEKKSPFGMFHANQQLVLLITAIIVHILGTVIPLIGLFIILPLGMVVVFVLALIGLIHAAKGEMKPLPLIGGFSIIK